MTAPKIRKGKFGDIPEIVDMIHEGHARSRYADLCEVNDKLARSLVQQAMQRTGDTRKPGSQYVAVAEKNERLEGFVIGLLQPLYHVLDMIEATDVFLYARPKANAATGKRLLAAFHKWAESAPGKVMIRQGNSDAITNLRVSDRVLRARGMRRSGHIFEKEVG